MANILRINGCTRELGKSQGFLGLPIRDEMTFDSGTKQTYPCMVSAWELMPNEQERIRGGKPLMLRVIGQSHPPVAIYVGDEAKLLSPAFESPDNWYAAIALLTSLIAQHDPNSQIYKNALDKLTLTFPGK